MKPALVRSGSGARRADEVGALTAIADRHAKHAYNPFSIISGTCAGAVNAVALAISADHCCVAVKKIESTRRSLHAGPAYEASAGPLLKAPGRLPSCFINADNEPPRRLSLEVDNIYMLVICPSVAFDEIAARPIRDLPRPMQVAIRATGATPGEGGVSLASRLLLEEGLQKDLNSTTYEENSCEAIQHYARFIHPEALSPTLFFFV